jgi:hypothetical protein
MPTKQVLFALLACTSSFFVIGADDPFTTITDSLNACKNKQVRDSCTFGSIVDSNCQTGRVSVVQPPFVDC